MTQTTASRSLAARAPRVFRIASSVDVGGANPYLDLFYDALSDWGIQYAGTFQPTPQWLRHNHAHIDALHFHWAENLLRRKPEWARCVGGFRGSWRLQQLIARCAQPFHLAGLSAFLRAGKSAGKRILWTLHNLDPHERSSLTQRAGFRALAKYADLIICHDAHTRLECLRRYHTNAQMVLMPHGNYDGAYPAPRCRPAVRRQLGFDDNKALLCCLGAIRHYKGFDLAVEAVGSLAGEVQLLVAGAPLRFHLPQLAHQVAQYDFVRAIPRRMSRQELADFAHASDGVILPYRSVTGSGALLAAATFGRAVIASDLPFFRAILEGNPKAGVLFRPGDAAALREAIQQYLAIPAATRHIAARGLAGQYSWHRVIVAVVHAINRWRRD